MLRRFSTCEARDLSAASSISVLDDELEETVLVAPFMRIGRFQFLIQSGNTNGSMGQRLSRWVSGGKEVAEKDALASSCCFVMEEDNDGDKSVRELRDKN